jgi:hypothetical protein
VHTPNSLIAIAAVTAALVGAGAGAVAATKKPAKPEAAAPLSEGQMQAAARVFVGDAPCAVGGLVKIAAVKDKPGHFMLQHGKAKHEVVPAVTETGAVRLENKKTGIVWIQIPAKSMMMNDKLGQRVADGCKTKEQTAGLGGPVLGD